MKPGARSLFLLRIDADERATLARLAADNGFPSMASVLRSLMLRSARGVGPLQVTTIVAADREADKPLQLLLSESERQALDDLAEKHGTSRTRVLRSLVRAAAAAHEPIAPALAAARPEEPTRAA